MNKLQSKKKKKRSSCESWNVIGVRYILIWETLGPMGRFMLHNIDIGGASGYIILHPVIWN